MTGQQWWRGAVIYQVYPRSFLDTDGDGVGDLPGIVARLDHIASLGVDAIWVSPFFKSPMADFGYDIADFRDVDPLFGTLEDFDRLLREAHARGLGRFRTTAFCAVDRDPQDPRRPAGHRGNEAFWTKRGYARQADLTMRLDWDEPGIGECAHALTFWTRPLEQAP